MDKNFVTGLLAVCAVIGVGILFIIGIFKLEEATAIKTIDSDDMAVGEWISPDGVHYWYREHGYGIMFAPRYDADGNLVIDLKEDK